MMVLLCKRCSENDPKKVKYDETRGFRRKTGATEVPFADLNPLMPFVLKACSHL